MTPIRWKRTMWSNAWQSWLHLLSLESNTSSWAGDCTGLALIPCKDRFSFILTQATLAVPLPREVWRLLPRKTRQPWLAKVDGLLFTIWHIASLQCIGRVFEKGTKGWHEIYRFQGLVVPHIDDDVPQQPLRPRKHATVGLEQLGRVEGILRLHNRLLGRPSSWRGQRDHPQLEDKGSEVWNLGILKVALNFCDWKTNQIKAIIFFLLFQEKRKHYFEKCPACIQKHFMRRPL